MIVMLLSKAAICVLQVSPLFGTIYSSIFFMAHAVHRVRQSEEWMSGGNLARRTQNLAFQVLTAVVVVEFYRIKLLPTEVPF